MLMSRPRSTPTAYAALLAPAPSRAGAFCLEHLRIRKLRPRFRLQNGMRFPERASSGNCVPELALRMGCAFRIGLQAEIASHSESSFWDTLSARSFVGKAHPIPSAYSGMRFPVVVHLETAAQFERLFRDAVSAGRFNRKACPVLGLDSGTRFPLGMPFGKRIPF